MIRSIPMSYVLIALLGAFPAMSPGPAAAQAPVFESVLPIGDTGDDIALAVDREGGIVVAGGCFQGTVDVLGTSLTSAGHSDIWIAAYTAAGQPLWTVQGSNPGPTPNTETGPTCVADVAIGAQGQVLVSGYYIQQLTIGGVTLPQTGPNEEGFIAAFDLATGALLWAKAATGMQVHVNGIDVDPAGGVCFVGNFGHHNNIQSSLPVVVDGVARYSSGGGDFFYGRIDPSGTLEWFLSGGSGVIGARDTALDVAATADGDCIAVGVFYGTANLGGQNVVSQGDRDGFVVRYDAAGAAIEWTATVAGNQAEEARAIDLSASGAAFAVAGSFSSTPASLGAFQLNSGGGEDAFVALLDPADGSVTWAAGAGGPDASEAGMGTAVDPGSGDVLLAGRIGDQAVFDGPPIAAQGRDVFLASYTPAGALRWVRTAGGAGNEDARDVAADATGASVAGWFEDSFTVDGQPLTSAGGRDALVLGTGPLGGPELRLPEIHAGADRTFTLPVELATQGAALGALAAVVDLPEDCAALETTADLDSDGIPDSIRPQLPAGYQATVFLDEPELEISMAFFQVPPTVPLPDGVVVEIDLVPTCSPAAGSPLARDLLFLTDPAVSFGGLDGSDVPGIGIDGSLHLYGGTRGDCNADGQLSAGDLTAGGLEIFDGDPPQFWHAPGGSFAGDPVGCNAQGDDDVIDAGDVACTVRLLFGLPCSGPARSPLGDPSLTLELQGTQTQSLTALIDFAPGGAEISALALSLDTHPNLLLGDVRYLGPGPSPTVTFDGSDGEGELDILWLDASQDPRTLGEGRLLEIDFEVTGSMPPAELPAAFSTRPEPSFGDRFGRSGPGSDRTVGEVIFADGFESGDLSAWE